MEFTTEQVYILLFLSHFSQTIFWQKFIIDSKIFECFFFKFFCNVLLKVLNITEQTLIDLRAS